MPMSQPEIPSLMNCVQNCALREAIRNYKFIWEERFDPFLHTNRLYQLVKQAKEQMTRIGLDHASLVSEYGGSYRLDPAPRRRARRGTGRRKAA